MRSSYVLVTAAYNEEEYIARTIESVVAQSVRPLQWAIVSDGSTDRTDAVVREYSEKYPFIRLLRLTEDHPRNFVAQVHAILAGVAAQRSLEFDLIGNLDADVSFGPAYFESLLEQFHSNPRLGLAGGTVREQDGSTRASCRGERLRAVPHAVQLFRRDCYDAVGGYPPLPYGGPDTYAEVAARMRGWEVECFEDLIVDHHRLSGSVGGILRGRFRQGLMDFSLGYHPIFELVKCARRIPETPPLIGAAVRLSAFFWAYLRVRRHSVSHEFISFLRAEQRQRLRAFFTGSLSPLG